MEEELTKWIKYGAYDEVEDVGQDRNDTTCIVNRREDQDGFKAGIRAWLCIRGFKEKIPHKQTV